MKAEIVKSALETSIQEINSCKWLYCENPDKDFSQCRKLSFIQTVSTILSFRGGTLNHDLREFFRFDPSLPTSSAFIQQRSKILPEAFEALFHSFTNLVSTNRTDGKLRLLAVDRWKVAFTKKPMAINYPLCTKFGLCYMECMLLFLMSIYAAMCMYYPTFLDKSMPKVCHYFLKERMHKTEQIDK